ncbi:MAG: hypothetical protein ABSE51_06265 [Terracidiphilus sp.]|jgi:hypothetical protein
MKTTTVQDICSELLAEIQELQANQSVLLAALGKAGATMSPYDAGDVKKIALQQAKKGTEIIQKRIDSLSD